MEKKTQVLHVTSMYVYLHHIILYYILYMYIYTYIAQKVKRIYLVYVINGDGGCFYEMYISIVKSIHMKYVR